MNQVNYKRKLNLETVEIFKIKLDVYFKYSKDFGFEVESIEDITGAQDLSPILSDSMKIKIEAELEDIYRRNGWL